MKKAIIIAFLILTTAIFSAADTAQQRQSAEAVLDRLQKRYQFPGFSARFHQESTIRAMDMTDVADGKILVKRPDKIRWDYETPEPQTIIANGDQLWIYRPEDRQVMIGRTPDLFGEGKGATFLADVSTIRDHFSARLEADDGSGPYRLRLTPKKKSGEIDMVHLSVRRDNYEIVAVVTTNTHGDQTRIEFREFWWQPDLSDEQFKMNPPADTEVITLDQ